MKDTISITLTLAIAFGLVLASTGLHSMSVFAQTNATKKSTTSATGTNATKASEASAGKSTAQKPSANKSSGGGKSTTPTSTVATVKGGPKAAGTASQLNQVEGNNTNTISKDANIANKPGLAGLSKESNITGK
jgi:hypothetical protein